MSVSIKIIDFLFWPAGFVKPVLVEHQRDLVRIEGQTQGDQMVRILTVEKTIPGITAARGLEQVLPVGRTLEDANITQVIGQYQVRGRQLVGCGQAFVAHIRKVVIIVLDVKLESEPDLMEVAQTSRGTSVFFGPAQSRQEQGGERSDKGDDHQKLDQSKCA